MVLSKVCLKHSKIGTCCFSAKDVALEDKAKTGRFGVIWMCLARDICLSVDFHIVSFTLPTESLLKFRLILNVHSSDICHWTFSSHQSINPYFNSECAWCFLRKRFEYRLSLCICLGISVEIFPFSRKDELNLCSINFLRDNYYFFVIKKIKQVLCNKNENSLHIKYITK